jgi:hypothetical protein
MVVQTGDRAMNRYANLIGYYKNKMAGKEHVKTLGQYASELIEESKKTYDMFKRRKPISLLNKYKKSNEIGEEKITEFLNKVSSLFPNLNGKIKEILNELRHPHNGEDDSIHHEIYFLLINTMRYAELSLLFSTLADVEDEFGKSFAGSKSLINSYLSTYNRDIDGLNKSRKFLHDVGPVSEPIDTYILSNKKSIMKMLEGSKHKNEINEEFKKLSFCRRMHNVWDYGIDDADDIKWKSNILDISQKIGIDDLSKKIESEMGYAETPFVADVITSLISLFDYYTMYTGFKGLHEFFDKNEMDVDKLDAVFRNGMKTQSLKIAPMMDEIKGVLNEAGVSIKELSRLKGSEYDHLVKFLSSDKGKKFDAIDAIKSYNRTLHSLNKSLHDLYINDTELKERIFDVIKSMISRERRTKHGDEVINKIIDDIDKSLFSDQERSN